MTYQTLLMAWDGSELAHRRFETVAGLADRFDAHVSVFCYEIDPSLPTYAHGAATASVGVYDTLLRDAQTRLQQSEQEATERLRASGLRGDIEVLCAPVDQLENRFADRARFADLTVHTHAAVQTYKETSRRLVEAVLFDQTSAVMVLPEHPPALIGSKAMIAWNESPEGLRAVRAALPLLTMAEEVNITMVDPDAFDQTDMPGEGLARFLSRHGISAEITHMSRAGHDVADLLAQRVRDEGADLLVMGAYGHSRFREYFLGGATRDILRDCPAPLLLAH